MSRGDFRTCAIRSKVVLARFRSRLNLSSSLPSITTSSPSSRGDLRAGVVTGVSCASRETALCVGVSVIIRSIRSLAAENRGLDLNSTWYLFICQTLSKVFEVSTFGLHIILGTIYFFPCLTTRVTWTQLKRMLSGRVARMRPCVSCVPDPTRMFDCNCGTHDSYCVKCGSYFACVMCEES